MLVNWNSEKKKSLPCLVWQCVWYQILLPWPISSCHFWHQWKRRWEELQTINSSEQAPADPPPSPRTTHHREDPWISAASPHHLHCLRSHPIAFTGPCRNWAPNWNTHQMTMTGELPTQVWAVSHQVVQTREEYKMKKHTQEWCWADPEDTNRLCEQDAENLLSSKNATLIPYSYGLVDEEERRSDSTDWCKWKAPWVLLKHTKGNLLSSMVLSAVPDAWWVLIYVS